ncbi:MAG: sulfotransferase domain-containing protein [Vicingus serpentipes]|nr:sulfotransferase domain-containing protein [Vicingus serpentipes]
MQGAKKYPDFLIVGAPKSGTTAFNHFLDQHPSIFMAKKELHYFGSDLKIKQEPLPETTYLSYFKTAHSNQLKGEASVWYLYSKKAAEEIKAFNPRAKIIILIRNPTEMIPSLHNQYLYNGDETEKDVEQAFENDLNRTTPYSSLSFENRPPYLQSVLYFQQVERYIKVFGERQVLIILHDEFKTNYKLAYRKVLNFLGMNHDFIPDFENINTRKNIQNISLHQLSKNPSNQLKCLVRFVIPFKYVRHQIMKKIDTINIQTQIPSTITFALKEKIIELTQADIHNLSTLIKKDLSAWLR